MREAENHLLRALRHHRKLAADLDDLGSQAEQLRENYRALALALRELGYYRNERVSRAMLEIHRSVIAIRKGHGDADDASDGAAGSCDRAADFLIAIGTSR